MSKTILRTLISTRNEQGVGVSVYDVVKVDGQTLKNAVVMASHNFLEDAEDDFFGDGMQIMTADQADKLGTALIEAAAAARSK